MADDREEREPGYLFLGGSLCERHIHIMLVTMANGTPLWLCVTDLPKLSLSQILMASVTQKCKSA